MIALLVFLAFIFFVLMLICIISGRVDLRNFAPLFGLSAIIVCAGSFCLYLSDKIS